MEIVKTYVGAYGIIIKDNKIALIRKAGGGYKGKLDLPGGGIEHTETPEEALKRELLEEIEAEVTSYELFDVTATNIKWEMKPDVWEDLHHIGILYKAEINTDKLKSDADGRDSEGAAWYEIDSLAYSELSPFASFCLKKIRK